MDQERLEAVEMKVLKVRRVLEDFGRELAAVNGEVVTIGAERAARMIWLEISGLQREGEKVMKALDERYGLRMDKREV